MSFDRFKAMPMQRFTSSLWNSLMDQLNTFQSQTSSEILKRVKYEDLSSLQYSIVPDQAGTRDLGSSDRTWNNVYARSGVFTESLTVQGKPVIKDGDPISIADILDTARQRITQAVDAASFNQVVQGILSRIDVNLSTRASEGTLASVRSYLESRLNVDLSSRASEATLQNVLSVLSDVLPQLAKDSTLQELKAVLNSISNTVSELGTLSLLDSTTAPLDAGESWTSVVDDSLITGRVVGSVYSDAPGTLYVEQSPDGTNWDIVDSFSVPGGSGVKFSVEKVCQYVRVRYVNGDVPQTVFRLYVYRRFRVV